MNPINRPNAGNYKAFETMRKTLSGKSDSVFSYRSINPYSMTFEQFKSENNENLDETLWQQAANKGELDQYINLLMQNPKKSAKLAELTSKYGGRVDYDTAMLALSYDVITDDVKEDRFDSNGNLIGNMSQRELIDKVLTNQAEQWDAQMVADEKKSDLFWRIPMAVSAELFAFATDLTNGLFRNINQTANLGVSAFITIKQYLEGKVDLYQDVAKAALQGKSDTKTSFTEAFARNLSNAQIDDPQLNPGGSRTNALAEFNKINEAMTAAAYDIRRKYSYSVDPATGEYKLWGKLLHGMADSIGYMVPALLTGNAAAMYAPMFAANMIENVKMTGYNTDYRKIFTNAALKTTVEYAIEVGLGKLIGFSQIDKLIGFGDDALKVGVNAVTKGVTQTTGQAAKQVISIMAKDMVKEGLEEVLQDTSGMIIDYIYGDQYAKRGKDAATWENLSQAFIIGAATSMVIGGFSNLTVDRAMGVNENGQIYQMGMFQSVTYKQALATLNSWQAIANDAKADPADRIAAALKLEGAVATLGTLYESLGVDKATKAEKTLLDIQRYHEKKAKIASYKTTKSYIESLTSDDAADANDVGGSNWNKAFNAINNAASNLNLNMANTQTQTAGSAYVSVAKAIQNALTQAKLKAAGVTKVETPTDLTGKTPADTEKLADDSIYKVLKDMGFNVAVRTDGNEVITVDDVIFLPEAIADNDTQALIKAVATSKTIDNVMANIPAALLQAVVDTYTKAVGTAAANYTEEQLKTQAIGALMFDKNFQLKMLLETNRNNNTWGTEQVINFIKDLKKQIAKKFTTLTPDESKHYNLKNDKVEAVLKADPEAEQLSKDLDELNKRLRELNVRQQQTATKKISIVPFPNGNKVNYTGTVDNPRGYVIVEYNGVRLPFYLSSGEVKKEGVVPGQWYPVFGVDAGSKWIKKGTSAQIANYYNQPILKEAAEYLDKTIGDIREKIAKEARQQNLGKFTWREEDLAFFNEGLPITKSNPLVDPVLDDASTQAIRQRLLQIRDSFEGNNPEVDQELKKVKNAIDRTKKELDYKIAVALGEAVDKAKPKRVLDDITKNITKQVVESLQESIVAFNLTIARHIDYDTTKQKLVVESSMAEVLEPTQITELENDLAIRFSSTLDTARKMKLANTPELQYLLETVAANILILNTRSNAYAGFISGISKILKLSATPTVKALEQAMLNILTTGTDIQRTDLVATLTYIFQRRLTDTKLYYIAKAKTNLPLFVEGDKVIRQIEKKLLGGQKIADILATKMLSNDQLSRIDPSLSTTRSEFAEDPVVRFIEIDNLVKRNSSNKFAILQDGTLIKLEQDTANLVKVIQDASTTEELLEALKQLKLSKPDKILRLQDLFKINLGEIGNVAILVASGPISASGYYSYNFNVIALNINTTIKYSDEAITILFHEMIHATNSVIYKQDIRYQMVGGGSSAMASQLNRLGKVDPSELQRLSQYITTNFPITNEYMIGLMTDINQGSYDITSANLPDFLGNVLYLLLQEENTARSIAELYEFSALGFTVKVNKLTNMISLVSPDGKEFWVLAISKPMSLAKLPAIKNSLLAINVTTFDQTVILRSLLNTGSIVEMQELAKSLLSADIEAAGMIKLNYEKNMQDLIDKNMQTISSFGLKQATVDNIKTEVTSALLSDVVIRGISRDSLSINSDYLASSISYLKNLPRPKIRKLAAQYTGIMNMLILNFMIELDNYIAILEKARFAAEVLEITHSSYVVSSNPSKILELPTNNSEVAPTSFNFGEYSIVKHTGRSYMLTKHNSNGKYITQEVDKTTLLPVRPNQKPLIEDQAQRDKMLFVIAKKTDVAKNTPKEPELPRPTKPTKPAEKQTVFQWGGWLVKEYDATHYVVSKNIDQSAHLPADDDYTDKMYEAIQVVSKKTLLPDTMLGATGKPILSASERSNILDWIAHETSPQLLKVQDKENPDKERWIYRPNLSDGTRFNEVIKQTDNATPSSIAFKQNAQFKHIGQYLGKKASDKLQDIIFKDLNVFEVVYLMTRYSNLPIENAINLHVNRYFNSEQGKAIVKAIPEAKTLLTDRLIKLSQTLNKQLKANPDLNSELTDLISDYAVPSAVEQAEILNLPVNKAEMLDIPANNSEVAFEMPRSKRTYIQLSRAKKSNLIYFFNRAKAKGQLLQMHDDVVAFVEGTTEHFDKLSKFFQVRIQNGTLTRHDITEYVATVKISTINDYTWKALLKYIYKNPALEAIGPSMIEFLIDPMRLEKLAIIARMTKDPDQLNRVHTVASFQKLIKQFDAVIKTNDPVFMKEYWKVQEAVTAWWTYNEEGKLVKDIWIMKDKQIFPIFLSLYQGTLKSLNSVFSYAKTVSGKQEATTYKGEAGEEGHDNANANKTTKVSSGNAAVEDNKVGEERGKGPYNWVAHARENIIDYELTGYMPEEMEETFTSIEEMTDDQKFNLIYEYFMGKALSHIVGRKPTEQEEAEANNDVIELMESMTDEQVSNTIRYILDEKIHAFQVRKAQEATKSTRAALNEPSAERKVAKDFLRNKANVLIRKLAGSKVAYNQLPAEVQALINFTPTNSRVNVEAYTDLSNPELTDLTEKVVAEIDRINAQMKQAKALEKTKATIAKKAAAVEAKAQKIKAREAQLKAREKQLREAKDLRGKVHRTFEAKVEKQTFTITGPSEINPKLQTILNHTWNKSKTSKVKYMDDSVQTIQNVHIASEFYAEHANELATMTLAEIEDVTDWLIQAHLNNADSVAEQTFAATKFFILAYIYNETDVNKGIFSQMNANLKTKLADHLKGIQTNAGTLLSLIKAVKEKLNPASIITISLFNHFGYTLTPDQEAKLNNAFNGGDTKVLAKTLSEIKQEALKTLTPEKASALRKVAAIRSMSMVSSPMTWIRNITSNYAISGLNRLSTKIGDAFLPKLTAKTENTPTQYKLTGKVTPEIQKFITEQFIESGFFDETLDQISKYNPSQVLRHKKVGEQDIIEDMLIHSIYNHFYSESMFDSKLLNQIHVFLMKRLSDKNFVREAAVRYLGKMLAETNNHLDATGNLKTGFDKALMTDVANAFALATTDYMHSDNFFSHLEKWLNQHSQVGWAAYKTIMPFATASWNWFKAAIRYSPVGLAQSIVKLTRLEQEIAKQEALWQRGDTQLAPELMTYLIKRDLGSGIIGTMAFGFGAILAALGYISLEDDDWGTPKLRVGNLRIDISTIFGSSSALAGAAFIKTLQDKDLASALDAMLDPLVDGFFFTDLLLMDANSPKGWFEWSVYQLQSIALSFIPSGIRYVSGMTYTGNYRTNTLFQKAVVRLPFLGQAFNVPKKTNIYTGDSDGTFWDIVHRMLPYFELVTKTAAQTQTEVYGLNKEELNGTYKINGVPFKTSPKETAQINKLYGSLNAQDLTNFYANQSTYRVLNENGRFVTKRYSQMTEKEIQNALDQIFSRNADIAKISAWLQQGNMYYTTNDDLFAMLRKLGFTKVFKGNKGYVEV